MDVPTTSKRYVNRDGLPKPPTDSLVSMPINRKHAATAAGDIVALQHHSSWRAQKEELENLKELEDAEDKFIESLIYHKMWNSDACWKTIREVSDGLRRIKTKSGKYTSLKYNICINGRGLGGWNVKQGGQLMVMS